MHVSMILRNFAHVSVWIEASFENGSANFHPPTHTHTLFDCKFRQPVVYNCMYVYIYTYIFICLYIYNMFISIFIY